MDIPELREKYPNYTIKPPLEHQTKAFEKLSERFSPVPPPHKSGLLVLPTSGKTLLLLIDL